MIDDFKPGDRVRYTGKHLTTVTPERLGNVGVVDAGGNTPTTVRVKWEDGPWPGAVHGVYPENLEHSYDFKVGDWVQYDGKDPQSLAGSQMGLVVYIPDAAATFGVGYLSDERGTIFSQALHGRHLTRIPSFAHGFKVGDRVQYKKDWPVGMPASFSGKTGTVRAVTTRKPRIPLSEHSVPIQWDGEDGADSYSLFSNISHFVEPSPLKVGDRVEYRATKNRGKEVYNGTLGTVIGYSEAPFRKGHLRIMWDDPSPLNENIFGPFHPAVIVRAGTPTFFADYSAIELRLLESLMATPGALSCAKPVSILRRFNLLDGEKGNIGRGVIFPEGVVAIRSGAFSQVYTYPSTTTIERIYPGSYIEMVD